jgi:uncharacterized membrane protein YgcG
MDIKIAKKKRALFFLYLSIWALSLTIIFSSLIFTISLYSLTGRIVLSGLDVLVVRDLPASVNLNEVFEAKLTFTSSYTNSFESVLITENVPLNFEILSASPAPLFIYKQEGLIVWGGKNYVPNSEEVYSYKIKLLDAETKIFEGVVGIVFLDGNESDFAIQGDNYVNISSIPGDDGEDGDGDGSADGGGGAGGGGGGGSGGGAGIGVSGNKSQEKEKSFGEKWGDLDEQEKAEIAIKSVDIVIYVLAGLIFIIVFILVILLIREKRKLGFGKSY